MIRPEIGKRYKTRDGTVVSVYDALDFSPSATGVVYFIRFAKDIRGQKAIVSGSVGQKGNALASGDPHPLDLIKCIGKSNE